MINRLLAVIFFFIFGNCDCAKYRGSSFHKLDNGISVVFVDTEKSDSVLVMLCISAGSTDEIDKSGVANLLRYMFAKKLRDNVTLDSLQYGSESNSYTGYDQSVYYFYGKTENLDGFLKNLGTIFSNFTFSSIDMNGSKSVIERRIDNDQKIDRNVVKRESMKSIYWHSNYGNDVHGDINDLKSISEKDIEDFKKKNYTNNRTTIIIAGNVNQEETKKRIVEYFGRNGTTSSINRLQEPPHHGATTRITKHSSQTNVPIIEMYWRMPNYRTEKEKARAAEIFINYLHDTLKKKLINEQQIISSISIDYSCWNYDYGDLCIIVTLKNLDSIENRIVALLSEVKYIALNGINEEMAKITAKKLSNASKFSNNRDAIDLVNWLSQKIESGNDFDFIKSYSEFVKKFDINEINTQAKAIFKNDPCVISVIKPTEEKSAF